MFSTPLWSVVLIVIVGFVQAVVVKRSTAGKQSERWDAQEIRNASSNILPRLKTLEAVISSKLLAWQPVTTKTFLRGNSSSSIPRVRNLTAQTFFSSKIPAWQPVKGNTKLLLFLGCSLDLNAVKAICAAAGTPLIWTPGTELITAMPFHYYLAHCTIEDATVAFIFHPGSAPPPYFYFYVDNGGGTVTTQQIINKSVADVTQTFGQLPSAIVVDASLWDVATWWQKKGFPALPYPVPQAEITQWCREDVPRLLLQVQSVYPAIPVAFRTPPPVFGGAEFGLMQSIVDSMVGCIAGGALTQYAVIDYYSLAQPPNRELYADDIHPGYELSLKYGNVALAWMRAAR